MAFNNNNRPQVDYLLVKQLITKLGDSSFLNTIRVGLREYNADNLGEREIVDTVEHIVGEDLAPYENLLSEFRDVLSTFGVKNVNKLYHFLYIALMCSQHFQLLLGQEVNSLYDSLAMLSQQTNYTSSYTDNASSDMEIFAYPEHQSPLQQIVAQIESEVDQQMEAEPSILVSPTTLKADAEPFTPKGKGIKNKRVSYADAVKQDSNSDTSRPSSPSPTMSKKKMKTAPVSKSIIAIKFKSQQKYTTAWTAPLGGIPVRWFPVNWDLKQRKERERFQAVLIGVPANTNIATLYLDNPAHSILTPTGCKAFKLIQDRAPAN
ncbi:unnamed protein product [Rhizophagus irregularis]|nr:unnamed protein product [Rhizophagus irregularis]